MMKQYTTTEQTAKLIEMGFEKPKSIGGYKPKFSVEYEGGEQVSRVDVSEDIDSPIYAYSIGELIAFCPTSINVGDDDCDLEMYWDSIGWRTDYHIFGHMRHMTMAPELIDCLFEMVVKLKEEGVI